MLATTDIYDLHSTKDFRELSWQLRASFDKSFDPSVTFFTLDVSQLDGIDILANDTGDIVREWDKYYYENYSNRVVSIEVTREETEPYSVASAFADIVLKNDDDFFTPGSGSPIDSYILPKRPFRLFLGFKGQNLPVFVGMNEKMPEINLKDRTAKFHLTDFLTYLYDQDVSQTIILENKRTDEILDFLFGLMGLIPGQYELDSGISTVRFFFVEKGEKFGDVVKRLMESEIGRLYMDERGTVVFKNRYNYNTAPVAVFDDRNIIDYQVSSDDAVINKVSIQVPVRVVQIEQSVWRNSENYFFLPGETIEVFVEFQDPVTTHADPIYSATPILDSFYTSTQDPDGNLPYLGIDFVDSEVYAKWGKFVFKNNGTKAGYIYALEIFGTPAKILTTLKVEDSDPVSIGKFEERPYSIQNEYIQSKSDALSIVGLLLHDFSEYGSIVELQVKSNFALQLGDTIRIEKDGVRDYQIMRIEETMIRGQASTQRIRAKQKKLIDLFILDKSILDGSDILSI